MERARSDHMVLEKRTQASVAEDEIAGWLRASSSRLTRHHPFACVMYADIKGFTSMAHKLQPRGVMRMLNQLFVAVDALLEGYGVCKVETIGDCYVAATGLDLSESSE